MTKSSLRERFEQQGLVRGIGHVHSGSPETVVLRLTSDLSQAKSIEAVIALRRRGASTLRAKRAVEAAMERRASVVSVPHVENARVLAKELRDLGYDMHVIKSQSVDVRRVREQLGLTQEQFALRFGLELDAVQNWERGRREPDVAARFYLTVIEKAPNAVQEALAVAVE
jgi:DNA-binding transcriptional regulator YiaG